MAVRKPAVAGSFYPSAKEELRRLIQNCYLSPLGPGALPPGPEADAPLAAVVCPHAGYEYSGPVAAHGYLSLSSLRSPDLIVVVAPNHYGIGSGVSTFDSGRWETPLGSLSVDEKAAKELSDVAGIVSFDPESHRLEHSLEVQLPFLQMLYGDSPRLLPISLLFQDIETARTMGDAISRVVKGRRAALIASSDLTHYEPATDAKRKDTDLLKKAVALDTEGFYKVIEEEQVTACGYGAMATVMESARLMGLKGAEVLKYATSGDTTGDNAQVVGYCAMRFV